MTILIDRSPINLATGTHEFGPAAIQDNTSEVIVRLARKTTATPTLWPNASTLIKIAFHVSTDGGLTYPLVCGFGSYGGILLRRDGSEAPESYARCTFPSGVGRTGKTIVTVTDGPLESLLTVEVI